MKKRIDYFDGVKGICAILVSLYHFMLAGYNAGFVGFSTNYTEQEALNHIYENPISAFITNNSVGLYIFLVLIAVFPIVKYRKNNSDSKIMGRYAVKRYFQLLPICFITSIIMVLMYKVGVTSNNELSELVNHPWPASLNPDHSEILTAIKPILADAWISNTREVASLWCLSIIFKGSMAVYIAYALFGNCKNKYLPTIVLLILSIIDVNYILFAFGSIVGEWVSANKVKSISIPLAIFYIILGIFVVKIPNNLYPFALNSAVNGGLGAFIIIVAVVKCENLQKVLSNKILKFLGLISFELIIGHVFVFATVTYPLMKFLLIKMQLGFGISLITGIIETILSIPISYALSKLISPLGIKLSRAVENVCFGQ